MKTKFKRRVLIGLLAVILVVCGVLGVLFALPQFSLAEANASENVKEPTAVKNAGFTVLSERDLNSNILLTSASVPTVSDTTPPTLSLTKYSTGGSVDNGGITNERVSIKMTDVHPNLIYYKTPSMTSYTYTTENPYVIGTENGTYSVYATDTYGNKSSTFSFTFDDTRPVGTLYCNGKSISSGSYIADSFCFVATDATSGIKQLYYKTPVNGSYQPYVSNTTILSNTGDGWYYFYAVDNAGNATSTFKLFLEAQAPIVNIYRNNSLVYSKTITVTENVDTDIYFKRNDKLKITYTSSSGQVTSDYTLNSNITLDSSYTETSYYIGLTTALGKIVNLKYHVVQNEPYIIVDGTTYTNGASIRYGSDKTITFMDDPSIQSSLDTGATFIAEGGVNLTEFIAYSTASTKKLTTASGTETKYTIRMTDRAGNQSSFTIVIDKLAPVGDWYANGVKLADNSYTASSLSFVYSEASVTATYSLNSGSNITYYSGTSLTAGGDYRITLTDSVGNRNQYTAHIDKTIPSGTLYANGISIGSGSYTNKSFYYTATDSGSGIASLYYRTPSGSSYKAYQDGTAISSTAENGWYYFYSRDKVGNQSSTVSVYLDSTKPTLTLKGSTSGSSLSSGASTGERIVVTASDFNFRYLYYKSPSSSSYTSTSSKEYTTGTQNGWYYFYAVDVVGNSSEVVSVYYDNTVPTGSVYSESRVVQNNAYVAKGFSYSATDSGCGLGTLYYKTPSASDYKTYQDGTLIPASAENGKYSFYATDKVGNRSSVVSVYLDSIKPEISMTGYSSGGSIKFGDNSGEPVRISASDINFSRLYYKTPSSSSYSSSASSSYITGAENGWYYFYAVDVVGNSSEEVSIYYDNAVPVGAVYVDGKAVQNNVYIAKGFYYSATDSGCGIDELYYKTPSSSNYKAYQDGTLIPASSENGEYSFYAIDKVGNRSSVTSVYLDSIKPDIVMTGYSSGKNIKTGTYTGDRIKVSASDINFSRLYYKTPSSADYVQISSDEYITGTENGWYKFYATDSVGNVSETLSVYYDNIAPTASVYSGGSVVNNNAYISNSFSYSASDNGSGIAAMYCKTPVSGVYLPYSAGTVISASSDDGAYYFYSVDNVGNQSGIFSVYLETKAPLLNIYRNAELVFSKAITENISLDTNVYFSIDDVMRIMCETSSGKVTSNYKLDSEIAVSGLNGSGSYTIDVLSATGLKGNFDFHVVSVKPVVEIDGVKYSDGATVSFAEDKEATFMCDSAISEFANTGATISVFGGSEFISYAQNTSKLLTTADGTETEYIIRLNDRAGNESTVFVLIDKRAATGVWESDGRELPNGGYTNKPLSFNFTEEGVTATYSHNGSEYKPYINGQELTKDGRYIIILADAVGNKSTFEAFKNTVVPIGQIYADNKPVCSGIVTNKHIFFSWDGDIKVTVNGTPYVKNSILTEDAVYKFVLTDSANNTSEYVAEIDTVAPVYNQNKLDGETQLISRWYAVVLDSETYTFANYDEALSYASGYEFTLNVTKLVLNDIADFNQNHLVADNDEVAVGTYWLYKSKANPDTLLYYFNRSSLDKAIEYYAKNYVSEPIYFVPDTENVYGVTSGSMSDNKFIASDGTVAPLLNGFIFDKADGCRLFAEHIGGDGVLQEISYGVAFDSQVFTGGLYKFTEYDLADNKTVFYGFMDTAAPELKVKAEIVGNETVTDLSVNCGSLESIAAYYYKSFNISAIVDADAWSVLAIENGGETQYYTYDDELPCFVVGGEYRLIVYDRLNNGYSFTVYIIGNPASVAFENNADDTAFDLTITLEQKFDTVVSLEIRRNGELLGGITTTELHYVFECGGVYTVILKDNFGRVIEKEYIFNKALPEGILEGVENGGKTKTDVTFTYDHSKYFIELTKDGNAVQTDNNGRLSIIANDANSGKYTLKLIRITDLENFTEYSFIINTLAPDFALTVDDGTTTNKNVTVKWTAYDIVSAVYSLNGCEPIAIQSNMTVNAEGVYIVTVTNDLGTQSHRTFTIDKTLDYDVLIDNVGMVGVDTTNSNVTVINNEPLYVDVTLNAEAFEFGFGQVLSDEGVYCFRIYDDYNNSTSFTVVIDKSVDVHLTVGNGVISNDDVIITAGEKINFIATKDGAQYQYDLGTAISDEGIYKFIVHDSYGNEKTVSFQIVKGAKTKLDYKLGESVEIISILRDGEEISIDGNRLNFTEDGTYKIVCISEGEEYTFELTLDTTAPTISLNGIEDGGKGNVTVTITDLSEEGTVEVYKDGERIEYNLGDELKDYGSYEVRVKDTLGNERIYNFTLKYQMSGIFIALIVIACIAAVGVGVFFILKKKKIIK